MFNIENRRYVGNKAKLVEWIKSKIIELCPDCHSFFDVFAGTGVVTQTCLSLYSEFIVNDLLYSNEVIYQAFFPRTKYDYQKLLKIKEKYLRLFANELPENYFSKNFGGKFFSSDDSLKIGFIRQDIEEKKNNRKINETEYAILLASLIYSADRASNTVGHYEAYIKGKTICSAFEFDLIQPCNITGKRITIYRKDSNELAKYVSADIAFVDPPYNSRQYSRFYHVLETLVKWDNPELFGIAMKPRKENMSGYCRSSAPQVFDDLVQKLSVKYIVVTYNNTYNSKSTSSQNKITLDQIRTSLEKRGNTQVFEMPYRFFNAGKTDLKEHKELLFITKVGVV